MASRSARGDALCEAGNEERRGLARAGVVERSHAHHRHAVVGPFREGDELGVAVRHPVGAHRCQRSAFAHRTVSIRAPSVLLGRTDGQHPRHVGRSARGGHRRGTPHVHPGELVAGVPGLAHVAARRQVVHRVRGDTVHQVRDGRGVGHVERHRDPGHSRAVEAMTSSPTASRCATRCRPTNPEAPVTSAFTEAGPRGGSHADQISSGSCSIASTSRSRLSGPWARSFSTRNTAIISAAAVQPRR